MKLDKMQAVVALDEGGTGWIIARSDHIREVDLLMEVSAEDNGFNHGWDKSLAPGVYLVTIEAWAFHDTMIGEYDAGVDVVDCVPLWTVNQTEAA